MRGEKVIVRCAFDDVFVGVILDENEAGYFITNEQNAEKLEVGDPSAVEVICGHPKSNVYYYDEEWLKGDGHKWENLTLIGSQVFSEK